MAPEDLQMLQQRLLLRPYFVWRLVLLDRSSRTTVAQERRRHDRFSPVLLRQSRMLDHAARALDQCPVHTLRDSVELRCVQRRELLHDASAAAERGELVGRVLAAVVAPKHLYALPGLGLRELDELHELVQHFRLTAK